MKAAFSVRESRLLILLDVRQCSAESYLNVSELDLNNQPTD